MYATWRDYNVVTNMGAEKEVLSFVGKQPVWWFHLSAPMADILVDNRVVGTQGELSKDISRRNYHGARPALSVLEL